MSCLPANRRFRLLDHRVGWDEDSAQQLVDLDKVTGVRLEGDPDSLSENDVDPFIAPPRLARGCGECDWFLATPAWPRSRLMQLDGCDNRWRSAWAQDCEPFEAGSIAAIAFDRDALALAEEGSGRILIMAVRGWRIRGESRLPDPVDLSFGPRSTLVVACEQGTRLEVLSHSGRSLGYWPAPLPEGRILRIAHDREMQLWLLMRTPDGQLALYRQGDPAGNLVAATLDELASAFAKTALIGSGMAGFTMRRGLGDGGMGPLSWDWAGRPLAGGIGNTGAGQIPPDRFARQGQLLTLALDSGIDRCVWHRLRIEADIPQRTSIEVAVATSDTPTPEPQGLPTGQWTGFDAGRPHPGDWQVIDADALDALILQPAGRYLFLRLRLSGDGQSTPHVRRIRIDLPRATSADLLPAIYREEPGSADFTERFLALFDSGLETIDDTIAHMPAALDAEATDPDLLPWLATVLGIGFDPDWDIGVRRRLLAAAPELFRRRGTRAGLDMALELIAADGRTAGGALIEESGLQRAWGALGGRAGHGPGQAAARLGATRLFSRAASRMKLDSSPIGHVPVMSYGNPEEDPHLAGAFRFLVEMPGDAPLSEQSLRAVVDSLKPAHTLASVRKGGTGGWLLGSGGRIGIDSLIRRPQSAVLGKGSARLGKSAVLGGASHTGFVIGNAARDHANSCSAGSIDL